MSCLSDKSHKHLFMDSCLYDYISKSLKDNRYPVGDNYVSTNNCITIKHSHMFDYVITYCILNEIEL